MNISTDLEGGVVMVNLSGKIMGEERPTTLFHGTIQEHLVLGKSDFIIDMTRVDWINSVGMGMLISALTSVRKQDGRFVLCGIDNVESLLTTTRLIKVFEHCGDRKEALWLFSEHNQSSEPS